MDDQQLHIKLLILCLAGYIQLPNYIDLDKYKGKIDNPWNKFRANIPLIETPIYVKYFSCWRISEFDTLANNRLTSFYGYMYFKSCTHVYPCYSSHKCISPTCGAKGSSKYQIEKYIDIDY